MIPTRRSKTILAVVSKTLSLLLVAAVTIGAQDRVDLVYTGDGGETYHRIECPLLRGASKLASYRWDKLPSTFTPCPICHPGDERPADAVPAPVPDPIVPGAPRWDLGPQPLNQATYLEAMTCGAESPWWRTCAEENQRLECGASGVYVELVTPFVRVMTDVDRATKRLERPTPLSLAAANRTPATVVVSPGANLSTMRSPARMMIEKGGTRIGPTNATLTPVLLENAFGVRRSAIRGEFAFPVALFAPTEAVTLLIAMDSGQPIQCELGIGKLKQMR